MPRQSEVFVRELAPAEAERLVKIARTAKDRVRLRRAGIVLASVQGRSATEAAAMFAATAQYAAGQALAGVPPFLRQLRTRFPTGRLHVHRS